MKQRKDATEITRADYEAKLAAVVADEKAKLSEKPTGFFGNWALHAAKGREFDRRLKDAGTKVVEAASTASPGTFLSASLRGKGEA